MLKARMDSEDTIASPEEAAQDQIWGDAQWRAMSSALRFELLIVASSICPATAQDFAEATGRTRASIYPHVQALVDAGFLTIIEHRPSARRPVAVYGEGPFMDTFPYDQRHFTRVKEWAKASRAVFRMHSREHDATMKALEGCDTSILGVDAHYLFGKIMHLDREGLLELVRLKNAIRDFASKHAKPNGGEIVRLFMGVIPDQRSPEVRAKRSARSAARRARK
jgi:hypothetical protein